MFTPVYMKPHLDGRKLEQAISRLDKLNQEKLVEAALHAPTAQVKIAAQKRLTDGQKVAEIARKTTDDTLRKAIVELLKDSRLLADFAIHDHDFSVCHAALLRVTDPEVLEEIEKNSKNKVISGEAFKMRISRSSAETLCSIAQNAKAAEERAAALVELSSYSR